MARPLTCELIRARTKSDNLYYVKKFTLCGNDIDDVRILRQMPNLEILSLSVNKINSLREFAHCPKLQELYVRNNNISNLAEVQYLTDLPDLRVLWLCENPCANHPDYRDIVINMLPGLTNLDKVPVTPEERMAASRLNCDAPEVQGLPRERKSNTSPHGEAYDGGYEEDAPRNNEIREAPGNYSRRGETSPQSYQDKYEINTPKNNDRRGTPGNYGRNYEPAPQEYQEGNEFRPYLGEAKTRESYRNTASPLREQKRNSANSHNQNTPPSLRNENVISAVLMLIKDLDESGLRIIKKDLDRRITAGHP